MITNRAPQDRNAQFRGRWTPARTSRARGRGFSIASRFSPASCPRKDFPNSCHAVLKIRALFASVEQIWPGVFVPVLPTLRDWCWRRFNRSQHLATSYDKLSFTEIFSAGIKVDLLQSFPANCLMEAKTDCRVGV
jgi:hypothetical protein